MKRFATLVLLALAACHERTDVFPNAPVILISVDTLQRSSAGVWVWRGAHAEHRGVVGSVPKERLHCMPDCHNTPRDPIPDLSYDLNYVLEFLFGFAQHMLEEDESFFPFGASLGVDFKIHEVEIGDVDEPISPQDMVDLLRAGLQRDAAAGKIIASGFCMNVITKIPGTDDRIDAVCAQIEHCNGENAEVYLPYWKNASGETVYEPIFITKSATEIFAPQPN